jgi:AcrR family transcriptional regulator
LIAENQRTRLINGMIEAVAEHGYGSTTISHITGVAKVSRRTFYESFGNKEDCYSAAYEVVREHLKTSMLSAADSEDQWPERVRSGLGALLEALAEHPDVATFFLISPTAAGDAIADHHHQAMSDLLEVLITGPPGPPQDEDPAAIPVEALAGGFSRLTARKASAGEAAELGDLLPGLVELVLRPFLGSEEAVRVARG